MTMAVEARDRPAAGRMGCDGLLVGRMSLRHRLHAEGRVRRAPGTSAFCLGARMCP
ncbi:hypothetical protein HMPREF1316_1233 [Olsenella profusa F0195]|uniref:Uncharacterized protein n=1 Tax=Olsenella profusa F0195 TaxID=1125712 RepID=U2SZV2_9ACTN|nr:hypothetical protein HMPREF1316_1233 [Olsenella profusa F0195]